MPNPHFDITITQRSKGQSAVAGAAYQSGEKLFSEYDQKTKNYSGNWKSHKEDTVDWNDQKYAEVWRQGWADTVNRYLEAAGRPERLDLRSYERQGLDVIATRSHGACWTGLKN